MTMRTFAAAVLASTLLAAPAFAQTADHADHHPQEGAAAAAAPSGMGKTTGEGMDMSSMMRMMRGLHNGMDGCMGEAALDHVDGRIAFLRAELHITDAQIATWNTFADGLRAAAQKSAPTASAMMDQGGFLDRIDRQERALTTKLDGVRALKTAVAPLYAALSDEQKKVADELVGSHFGIPMAVMSGMMDGGMMQGGMKPGAGMPMSGMGR